MTNVKLSELEMQLVTDAEVILTKNRIIQKVYNLFGDISLRYQSMNTLLPADVTSIAPKISRGENYEGLPWVMLDYPRVFSKTDVLAVRSFFWWGRFFSITLQLQGSYQQRYANRLEERVVTNEQWWSCVGNSDAWQHNFDDYRPVTKELQLAERPFIKVAKKIPLQQWDSSFDFFTSSFKEITGMLRT